MIGLLKQKENEVKSLWEAGCRLAKLVLVQKWLTSSCSKIFLFLCRCCQCEWRLSERSLLSGDILAGKGSTFPSSQGGDDELPGYFYICCLYDLIRLVRWRCNTVWCSVTPQMYFLQLLALLTPCHVKNFRESLLSLPVLCVPEHLAELFGKQVWIRKGYLVNQGYFKLWPENLRSYVARTGAISKEIIIRGTYSARKLGISQLLSSWSLCCCVKLFLLKAMASVLRKAKAMVHACGSTGQGASHPSILTEQVDLQISAQEKSWKLRHLDVMAQHRFSQNNRVVSKCLARVPGAVAVCDNFCSWVACLSEVLDRYFKAWHEGGFVAMLCVCCSLLPQTKGWVAFWWVN